MPIENFKLSQHQLVLQCGVSP